MQQSLYDRDLYDWATQTARLVREQRFSEYSREQLLDAGYYPEH